jgi:hypothetical protein
LGDLAVEGDESGAEHVGTQDLGWRAYQSPWLVAAVYSLGWCGFYGALSYHRTGNIVALEVAGVVAVPVCGFLRWFYPMLKYLVWGNAE